MKFIKNFGWTNGFGHISLVFRTVLAIPAFAQPNKSCKILLDFWLQCISYTNHYNAHKLSALLQKE